MSHVDAIESARALRRPNMHRKGHAVALAKRHDLSPRLHAWTLFGQHEFATGEIAIRLGQQDRDLQRKDMLAIEILMQAVIIARPILQQQRRRPGLTRLVASLEKSLVVAGIA